MKSRLKIGRSTRIEAVGAILVVLGGTLIMWGLEAGFTTSAAPFWDALVVALSLTAQFVMTRKVLEHWWLWIAVDIVGTVLFWSQNLQLTSILYVVYGCICVRGLVTWRRMYHNEHEAIVPDNPVVAARVEGQ